MNKLNYKKVFEVLVSKTAEYLQDNKLQAMVLGISGGIDSTVVAAICHEVSRRTGIPLIGRSLPIYKHADATFNESVLVGKAFCDDFQICPMTRLYHAALKEVYQVENMERHESTYSIDELEQANGQTKIANGNIQARLRMMFLYNLASIHKGLVMSTDNQTEYQLGFWTIHGDVGDFDPIQDLWKTEVYGLAEWIFNWYDAEARKTLAYGTSQADYYVSKLKALKASIALTPTDGLGISNSDLEQIGCKSYAEVDDILQTLKPVDDFVGADAVYEFERWNILVEKYGEEVVNKVWNRHIASEFKRRKAPIYIKREWYEWA